MSIGKAAALTAGFAGAFALGVLTGPAFTGGWHQTESQPAAVVQPQDTNDVATSAPAPRVRPRAIAPARSNDASAAPAESTASVSTAAPSDPDLQVRLKKVLRPGAKMDVASQGFKNGEQFAAVAHAARNTDVPFMLLKYRVVEEGKTLESAIRESKPAIDAQAEAARARDQARSDLDASAGN